MKHLVLLCDGMSDRPVRELGGLTPMEAAKKPHMDRLCATAELGMVKTVQDDMPPGSDVANLSVLGYDPGVYYSGRSPLEAAGAGVTMKPSDVSFRCNLVTLSDEPDFRGKTMLDYCAGDISSEEADVLIKFIDENLSKPPFKFHSGVSYRHLLIRDNGTLEVGALTPPHDILDKKIADYINPNPHSHELYALMEKSAELLKNHPVNLERVKNGKRPANSIWLWGEGKSRAFPSFREKFGLTGAMISAVDLLKGIGKSVGMDVINVPGATGYLDTNFEGKANAAIAALKAGADLVYLHVEAPDECGHRAEVAGKVKAIELIDERILKLVLDAFEHEPIKILICPDHPTPLELRTHTNEPVPFLIYDSRADFSGAGATTFTERTTTESSLYLPFGHELMDRFVSVD
ncbi:MAG: cofactor-independent phosphoglycerate mutase [Oscillospiraceae bacterium]|nr:cofactor-independent phosphoglycerate mutase [Oscillospiraceae bacterium]